MLESRWQTTTRKYDLEIPSQAMKAIDLMHNDVTKRDARGEFCSYSSHGGNGHCRRFAGECATVLCHILEAVQANEDPSFTELLHGSSSPESNSNSLLSSTSTNKRSSGFMCCVLVVWPTIKESIRALFLYFSKWYKCGIKRTPYEIG